MSINDSIPLSMSSIMAVLLVFCHRQKKEVDVGLFLHQLVFNLRYGIKNHALSEISL